MANDPQVALVQLAAIVAADPAFSAEIIRVANSPLYTSQTEVNSAQRATVLLGGRTLRCIAICFAARDVLGDSGFPTELLTDFWEDSLRRAVAARRLARLGLACDPEEAFTAGMLLEFGMFALLRRHPEKVGEWKKLRGELPAERRDTEVRLFGTTHDRILRELTSTWSLPSGLVTALAHHHHPDSPSVPSTHYGLTLAAGVADCVAAVFTAEDSRQALASARDAIHKALGVDGNVIDELVDAISSEVTEAASVFGINVRKQPTRVELLADANRALAALNLTYEELTAQLERALREREEIASELRAANERLQRLVYHDPLTGLSNRRRFEERLLEELRRRDPAPDTLSLLLLDLDHFKRVNDNHGHVVGDAALRAVAETIQRLVRASDIAARFGGEEIAVVLPNTNERDARMVAERLRRGIAGIALTGPNGTVPLTVSIGGRTIEGAAILGERDPARLMHRLTDESDRGLYQAKNSGRNCVRWFVPT